MHRFFVAPELVQQLHAEIPLPKELAHQLRDVLHLQSGEQITLLDNSGDEILASIASVNKNVVNVELLERRAGKSASNVRIILCQGLLKSARFEWILEKGTELGVSVFAPIICHRSMSGLQDAGTSKVQRWQRIIIEAAEQSSRTLLPELRPIRPLAQALNNIPPNALALMPWEEERTVMLRDALQTSVHNNQITVALFIGPEGGLTSDEVKQAQQRGVQVVSLGSRILRAETAALATVASVMYELEE